MPGIRQRFSQPSSVAHQFLNNTHMRSLPAEVQKPQEVGEISNRLGQPPSMLIPNESFSPRYSAETRVRGHRAERSFVVTKVEEDRGQWSCRRMKSRSVSSHTATATNTVG